MREITLYLIQVAAASGIFYAYYHFVLRNKKFHRYNRFYLLAASIISLVIPFLNIPLYFTETQQQSSALLQTLTVVSGSEYEQEVIVQAGTQTKQSLFTLKNILYVLYILTAAVALTRVFLSLKKIRKIVKNNPSEKIENIRFVNTDEPGTPFSFFRWLFWNRKIELNSAKGKQVFRHELFHIEQKHSFDIIFLELLTVAFWINPFFHLIKKEVKAIHEFLADQFAIHEENKWEYAELLLQQALDTKLSLVNPFFHNQIKRRIAMITNSKKPGHQYIRKLMALPVAAIAVGLFAFTYKSAKPNTDYYSGKQVTVVIDAGHGGNDFGAKAADGTTEKDLTLAIAKKIKELNTNENIRFVMTRETDIYPPLQNRVDYTKENNADVFLSLHINNSPDKTQKGSEAIVSAKNNLFENQNSSLATSILNSIADVWNVKMEIKKRQRGIWVIDNAPCPSVLIMCGNISNEKDLAFIKKEQNQEKIAQAILDGINMYLMLDTEPAPGKINANFDITDTLPKKKLQETEKQTGMGLSVGIDSNMLVVVNGIPVGTLKEFKRSISTLHDPETIEQLTIWKGAEAISRYGEKAKTGVVDITLKKNETPEGIVEPPFKKDTVKKDEEGNKIFDKIEEPAQFPGGTEAWKDFLIKNLNANVPADSGAAPGTYKVEMQFIVNTDGSISDIKPLTKYGFGMEKEVTDLLNKSPNWIPAKQNGRTIKSYHKIPVTFQISEESDNDIPKITTIELKTFSIYKLLGIAENSQIVSFTFTTDLETGDIVAIPNKGNQINPAIKNHLNTSKAGRLITFDDIIIQQNGEAKKVISKV